MTHRYPLCWVVIMAYKWTVILAGIIAASVYLQDRGTTDVLIAKVNVESREMYKFKLDSLREEKQARYSERRRAEQEGRRK